MDRPVRVFVWESNSVPPEGYMEQVYFDGTWNEHFYPEDDNPLMIKLETEDGLKWIPFNHIRLIQEILPE